MYANIDAYLTLIAGIVICLIIFLILLREIRSIIFKTYKWSLLATGTTLVVTYFLGSSAMSLFNIYQYTNFISSLDNGTYGAVSKGYLAELYPDAYSKGECLFDNTEISQQCLFISSALDQEEHMVDYVTNDQKIIFRSGSWPFATTIELPPVPSLRK